MKTICVRTLLLVMLSFFGSRCALLGQAVSGSQISGIVSDPQQALVPGATVTATQMDTGAVHTATTGASGEYTLADLPVGTYTLKVVAPGFGTSVQSGMELHDFVRMAEPIARSKGIIFGVEPIRYSSSNILSTGAEVVKFVREVNLPNLKMNIDYFQMRSMNESPDILWEARDQIVHIHFARFDPHGWPKSVDEDPEYKQFFGLLKKMNYKGGISVEAPGSIAENAPAALDFFKKELA